MKLLSINRSCSASSEQIGNLAVISWSDDDSRSYQYRIDGRTDNLTFYTLTDRTENTTASTTADTFEGEAR